ncbi:ABC-three component system protein [Avibacterium paragallinarum]|uniref:ABC-three component system protein n=1 Tax=Avibacterium paragallinarum TaxID=728 RepID=UPI0039784879
MAKKKQVSAKDTKILWGTQSQCTICRCRLWNNGHTIGEHAHIRGENPGSARYDKDYPENKLTTEENIILLCPNCHTEIDKDESKWSVNELLKIKKEFIDDVTRNVSNIEPPRASLIVDVVDIFYNSIIQQDNNDAPLDVIQRTTSLSEKNNKNDISQPMSDFLVSAYMKYFDSIQTFFSDPRNSESLRKLQGVINKLNLWLCSKNEGKLSNQMFYEITEDIIKKNSQLNGEREDTLSIILFYIYYHCDIGLK